MKLERVTVVVGTRRHVPAYAMVLDFDDRIPNKTNTSAVCIV